MASFKLDENKKNIKYVFDLPYFERMELCKILNHSEKWEELAGNWMKFDNLTIQSLRREKNPMDELLTLWGHYNHTILELFVLLFRMKLYQAMSMLKSFVEPKFHALIDKAEGKLQPVLGQSRRNKNAKDPKIVAQNLNQSVPRPSVVPKEASPIPGSRFSPVLQRFGSTSKNSPLNNNTESTLPQISYEELALAVNQWSKQNILGKGGFGTVYKGNWKCTDVAIKKIERRGPEMENSYKIELQQSLREIKILNSRPHENILPLYAYSLGGEAPCLVYQFMQNGSLEDRLFLRRGSAPLSWRQRHEIAKGTARGLQYLHTVGDKPLIHGDIKSANILLDKNFEPKIGDFGLAREGLENESMKVSRVYGTRPYVPDEFLRGKTLSTKIDTYSYGIVLFEIATGLPPYTGSRPEPIRFLKDFVDSIKNDRELPLLMDKKAGTELQKVYLNLMILGKWCSNRLAKDRPEMQLVYRELNNLG